MITCVECGVEYDIEFYVDLCIMKAGKLKEYRFPNLVYKFLFFSSPFFYFIWLPISNFFKGLDTWYYFSF